MFEEYRECLNRTAYMFPDSKPMMKLTDARAQFKKWQEDAQEAIAHRNEEDMKLMTFELQARENVFYLDGDALPRSAFPDDYTDIRLRRISVNKIERKYDRMMWEAIINYAEVLYYQDIHKWTVDTAFPTYPNYGFNITLVPGSIAVSVKLFDAKKRERQRWIDDRIWELRTFEQQFNLPKSIIYRIGMMECLYVIKAHEAKNLIVKSTGVSRSQITNEEVDDFIIKNHPSGFQIFN